MTYEDAATHHPVSLNTNRPAMCKSALKIPGGLALLALAGALLFGLTACTVDDSIIENKLCDLSTTKDRECVKGYEPHQESDGKCYCRPMKQSGLHQTPGTDVPETFSFDRNSHGIVDAPRPRSDGDPSMQLLRRLGVFTP
ncbi:MAG: hypothetical protein KAI47_27830 [Deltaproteobacteria bacterium]|nr:hypothetical protein [Deltaproteobacteria bacterium]